MQHATASWEATTGNTSVSAGYHTRIRCNAKKNNKKNKWSNDEVLIKKFYTFVQYQTQLHECIFSGKMFSYPVPHIRFIYESHHGKNSYHFSKKLAQCCTHQFLVSSASLKTFLSIKQYARCSHGLVALLRTPPSNQKKVSSSEVRGHLYTG